MASEFKLPDLGENIASGDIVNVLVKEGDQIAANQNVIEIETGKAVVELPCPIGGKVAKIHVKPGQTVSIGETLLTVEAGAGAAESKLAQPAAPAKPAQQPVAAKPAPALPAAKAAPAPQPAPASNGGAVRNTPVAKEEPVESAAASAPAGPSMRRLARELGVDLANVLGTGPSGRITREDIVASVRQSTSHAPSGHKTTRSGNIPEGIESRDKFGTVRKQPLSRIRKTIAENMVRSATTIPHVTNFDDADITELERIRKGSAADYVDSDIKLTMMPFVMKACAQALRLHPALNASLDMERGEIIYKDYVNLGVAVDTERGLVVPVVREVDRLSIPQLAQVLSEMTVKARASKFTAEDQQGGTFTISNLGAIGGIYSTPIINPPEVAILLVGRSRKLPVVVDDKIEVRLIMPLSISFDHRLVDGAAAARFLNEVKGYLQVPGRLLLAQ